MALKLITPPPFEPVSLAEAKLHLKQDDTADDALITALITGAREYCEGFQNRAYIEQTWDLWLDEFPYEDFIKVPKPPLQSVASVKYYDTANTEATFGTDDYFVDDKSNPGRVSLGYSEDWPTTTLRPANAVVVRFTAGYPTYSGTVDTNGTTVTWKTGDKFSTSWPKNKTIIINDVVYRIASVTSDTVLVLTATAGNQTGVAFQAHEVPAKVTQAMLLLIGHWYEQRQAATKDVSKEIEFAVKALLGLERVVPI